MSLIRPDKDKVTGDRQITVGTGGSATFDGGGDSGGSGGDANSDPYLSDKTTSSIDRSTDTDTDPTDDPYDGPTLGGMLALTKSAIKKKGDQMKVRATLENKGLSNKQAGFEYRIKGGPTLGKATDQIGGASTGTVNATYSLRNLRLRNDGAGKVTIEMRPIGTWEQKPAGEWFTVGSIRVPSAKNEPDPDPYPDNWSEVGGGDPRDGGSDVSTPGFVPEGTDSTASEDGDPGGDSGDPGGDSGDPGGGQGVDLRDFTPGPGTGGTPVKVSDGDESSSTVPTGGQRSPGPGGAATSPDTGGGPTDPTGGAADADPSTDSGGLSPVSIAGVAVLAAIALAGGA